MFMSTSLLKKCGERKSQLELLCRLLSFNIMKYSLMTVSVIHPDPLVEASARWRSIGHDDVVEFDFSGASTDRAVVPGSASEEACINSVIALLALGSSPALNALALLGCLGSGTCKVSGVRTLKVAVTAVLCCLGHRAFFCVRLHGLPHSRFWTAARLAVFRAVGGGYTTSVMAGADSMAEARYASRVPCVFFDRFAGRVSRRGLHVLLCSCCRRATSSS